jgi:CMP-N,N'-diacetyllegionaminic acid synthase
LDKVIVSTDSTEIAQVAEAAGASVPFIRPADLADDNSPMIEVLRHAVLAVEQAEETQVEAVVLIDPTAPLRKVSDVEGAIALFQEKSCDAVVSANLAARNPYFNMVEEQDGYVRLVKSSKKEIIRRQDCPVVYDLNTVVWVFSRWTVLECGERIPPRTVIFEIPAERAVDLDAEEDFRYLSFLMDSHRVEAR